MPRRSAAESCLPYVVRLEPLGYENIEGFTATWNIRNPETIHYGLEVLYGSYNDEATAVAAAKRLAKADAKRKARA